jgi:hypothetical protein
MLRARLRYVMVSEVTVLSQSSKTSRCRGCRVVLIRVQRDSPIVRLPGNRQRKDNVTFLHKDHNTINLIQLYTDIQLAIHISKDNDIDDSRPSSKGEKSYWILIQRGALGRAGRVGEATRLLSRLGYCPRW